jgi:hypothetical protein
MSRTLKVWPILNTILFTIFVPGTATIYVPYRILGGFVKLSVLRQAAGGIVFGLIHHLWIWASAPTRFVVTLIDQGSAAILKHIVVGRISPE